jgi:hypothetical protein
MQTTGMLKDDSRELSRWLSTRLGARYQLQRSNMQTNQTPEALAEECLLAMGLAFRAARYENLTAALAKLNEAIAAVHLLRDMAASGAKDAISFEQAAQPLMKWLGGNVHPHHTAVVTSTDAELLEGKQTIRTTQYVKD